MNAEENLLFAENLKNAKKELSDEMIGRELNNRQFDLVLKRVSNACTSLAAAAVPIAAATIRQKLKEIEQQSRIAKSIEGQVDLQRAQQGITKNS